MSRIRLRFGGLHGNFVWEFFLDNLISVTQNDVFGIHFAINFGWSVQSQDCCTISNVQKSIWYVYHFETRCEINFVCPTKVLS